LELLRAGQQAEQRLGDVEECVDAIVHAGARANWPGVGRDLEMSGRQLNGALAEVQGLLEAHGIGWTSSESLPEP
jgi:hypothetical protein